MTTGYCPKCKKEHVPCRHTYPMAIEPCFCSIETFTITATTRDGRVIIWTRDNKISARNMAMNAQNHRLGYTNVGVYYTETGDCVTI